MKSGDFFRTSVNELFDGKKGKSKEKNERERGGNLEKYF